VALKLAREDDASLHAVAREATLLARVQRRWGPALIDAGRGFVATEWIPGSPVDPRALPARTDRERLAALAAHGAGRALEELHEAGVRHGDVKPHNVLRSAHKPTRDAAADRGATLIDLGLAADVGAEVLGGTPRYASPELRDRGEAGPAADLWALGLVLAELLDPRVADAVDPIAAIEGWSLTGEPARWVEALIARAPGGRPSAKWLGSRAARWLELEPDERISPRGRRTCTTRAWRARSPSRPADGWRRRSPGRESWTPAGPEPRGRSSPWGSCGGPDGWCPSPARARRPG
jgi:serine/threonine protein kinase